MNGLGDLEWRLLGIVYDLTGGRTDVQADASAFEIQARWGDGDFRNIADNLVRAAALVPFGQHKWRLTSAGRAAYKARQ